jgi:hypothetical protein
VRRDKKIEKEIKMGGKEQVLIETIRNGDALAAIKLLTKNSTLIKKNDKSDSAGKPSAAAATDMSYPSKLIFSFVYIQYNDSFSV